MKLRFDDCIRPLPGEVAHDFPKGCDLDASNFCRFNRPFGGQCAKDIQRRMHPATAAVRLAADLHQSEFGAQRSSHFNAIILVRSRHTPEAGLAIEDVAASGKAARCERPGRDRAHRCPTVIVLQPRHRAAVKLSQEGHRRVLRRKAEDIARCCGRQTMKARDRAGCTIDLPSGKAENSGGALRRGRIAVPNRKDIS